MHLSNVFALEPETLLFRSPKLIVSCSLGDLVLAFVAGSDRNRRRDDCEEFLQKSWQRKQWTSDPSAVLPSRKNNNRERKVGVDAIFAAHEKRHQTAAQITDTAFEGDVEQLLKEATDLVQIIRK